jgi:benzoyl-CoA reductase/2-hydroxyglutaryl-CoA dehydratase subunit BcrC/BadD/HgdB
LTALEELSKPAETLTNPHVERWKQDGGQVIGYYCTYVPEEVIHAAGMLPYRVRGTGSTATEMGDLYLTELNCSFCRHSLDQAMRGEYAFLDGLVALSSCDHLRRMFDVWRYGKLQHPHPNFYLRFLSVPIVYTDLSVEWMAGEILRFRQSLEDHFQVEVSDEALRHSIRIYNEKRRLLKDLYELRKRESPPITGAEVLRVVIAGASMPVEQFNQLLTTMLDEVDGRAGSSDHRARLMLVGGELDDPAYIETIEELGGLIVSDSLCFGTRSFWDLVDEDAEPSPLPRAHLVPPFHGAPREGEVRQGVGKGFQR